MGGALTVALAGINLPAAAQTHAFPNKPVRLVVTFPAGGSSDLAARIVAPRLAERLGQAVVVDNRPGAGGGLGLDLVAKSPADGYTLVLASAGGLTANPTLYKKPAYNPARDFAPISLFGTSPFVLVANAAVPANSVRQLVALAKAQAGKLSYASGGSGTAMHLSGELLKSITRRDQGQHQRAHRQVGTHGTELGVLYALLDDPGNEPASRCDHVVDPEIGQDGEVSGIREQ